MAYKIFITPTAFKDLSFASEYYEQKSAGLGNKFNETIQNYFNRIAETPFSSSVRYRNIRCKPVLRFPFIIMYTIEETQQAVHILRVFNTYQEPIW